VVHDIHSPRIAGFTQTALTFFFPSCDVCALVHIKEGPAGVEQSGCNPIVHLPRRRDVTGAWAGSSARHAPQKGPVMGLGPSCSTCHCLVNRQRAYSSRRRPLPDPPSFGAPGAAV